MRTLSVSTLLTAAAISILSQNFATAQTPAGGRSSGGIVIEQPKGCTGLTGKSLATCEKREEAELANLLADLTKKNKDLNLGDCKEQMTNFNKVMGDYRKSCGASIGMFKALSSIIGAPDTKVHFDECAAYIHQCQNPDDTTSTEDDDEDEDEGTGAGVGASRRSSKSTASSDSEMKRLRESARMCSPPSGSTYKESRDALKDYRRERTRLEREGREAQNEMLEIAQEQKTANNRLDDRAEQIRLKLAERQREILAQKASKENQIKAAVVQAESEIDEIRLNVDRIKLSQTESEIALAEAIGQLERQCHAEALSKVEEHRKLILKQIESSTFTPGGQSNLFQGVGNSMKAKLKKLASDYFKDCKISDITMEAMRASKNRKALAVARAETEIQGLNGRIDKIRARIKELQTTERTMVLTEASENLKALQDEVASAGKKLDNNRLEIGTEAGMKMMKAQTKSANIGADLDRERADVEMDQAIVAIGKKLGLTPDSKVDELANAQKEFRSLDGAAHQAATQCCAPNPKDGNKPMDAGNCRIACKLNWQGDSGWQSASCPTESGHTRGGPGATDGER